ncbi:MAG: TRAP transporter substrate-binding protein DctP [Emcibacter sp.]|nr:TRAP transporter substrate-binding protein DctP [Emcibacter sp.]
MFYRNRATGPHTAGLVMIISRSVFLGILSLAIVSLAHGADDERDPIKLTVGAFAAPGTPWDTDWQTFQKNLDQKILGEPDFKVKLLIRGEAGGEPVTMTNIRRNRLQFGGFSIGGASAVIPELSVLLSPYVFDSVEELDYVMDNFMLDIFQPLFAEKGLILIRWVEIGWLHMYGKKPLLLPQDAAGYRLRSQASEASQAVIAALKGDMLQMPFHDLIPALQTGLVEGGETNVVLYSVTGISNEASDLVLTHHAYDTGMIVASKKWYDSLSPQSQQRVYNAFPSSDGARAGVRKMASALLDMLKVKPNVTVHELSPDQLKLWKEALKNNHQEIIRKIGGNADDIYQAMMAGRKVYRDMISARRAEYE